VNAVAGLSLRRRLLAGALVWITGSLLVAGLLLAALFRDAVERRFEAELTTHLEQLLAGLQQMQDGSFSLARPMTDPRFEQPYSALYWQVEAQGALLRSRSLWDATLDLPHDPPAEGIVRRQALIGPRAQHLLAVERTVHLGAGAAAVRAAVAGDRGIVEAATSEFVRVAAVTLGILAAGLVAAVVAQVLSMLGPLNRLHDALAAVRLGRAPRVVGRFPVEIQPLVDDLNGVLRHNASLLQSARSQADNLAHQLKTPLAVIANTAQGQVAGDSASTVLEQVALMKRRIDYALSRARAASVGRVQGLSTPIAPRIDNLVHAMRTLYGPRGIEIRTSIAPAAIRGDAVNMEAQDVDEVIGNLLDNACKWASTKVTVRIGGEAGRVRVIIEDDGPGLPEAERARVFERGIRLDESIPGTGLGLSIVRDILDAYGGGIELIDRPSGGLCATVKLPRALAG
jgi:signal transduction histidine kinase